MNMTTNERTFLCVCLALGFVSSSIGCLPSGGGDDTTACAEGEVIVTTADGTTKCTRSCASQADCAEGDVCEPVLNEDGSTSDGVCSPEDTDDNAQGCVVDSDCFTGYVCLADSGGSCVSQCYTNDDCFAGESCEVRGSDPDARVCVETMIRSCVVVDDCPNTDDYVCAEGECVEVTGNNSCVVVNDCPNVGEYVCVGGECFEI